MIIPLYSLIYFKISSYPQAIQYMLLFFLTIALGYDLPDLVSCLTLVKSKIDRDESSFDTMLSTSTLHPESLIDKIVADMLESCASQITPSISQEITPDSPDLSRFDYLLNFSIIQYTSPTELELLDSQLLIFSQLESYIDSSKPVNYTNTYLILTFSLVILLVLASKFGLLPLRLNSPKKMV